MPIPATAATSSGTRTTLSLSEYSVCSRRWTKACDIGLSSTPGAPQRTERAAVQRRSGTAGESLEVRRRAVALVAGEREARIARIERAHHRIAMHLGQDRSRADRRHERIAPHDGLERSEEHTSELQSPCNLVCRLLLE